MDSLYSLLVEVEVEVNAPQFCHSLTVGKYSASENRFENLLLQFSRLKPTCKLRPFLL